MSFPFYISYAVFFILCPGVVHDKISARYISLLLWPSVGGEQPLMLDERQVGSPYLLGAGERELEIAKSLRTARWLR